MSVIILKRVQRIWAIRRCFYKAGCRRAVDVIKYVYLYVHTKER